MQPGRWGKIGIAGGPYMYRHIFQVGALALTAAALIPAGASAAGEGYPGVQTFTAGAQCTSNFVFTDGSSTYLGQAAHCSGTGAATDTDGCTSESLPIGTPVDVTGASKPGTL